MVAEAIHTNDGAGVGALLHDAAKWQILWRIDKYEGDWEGEDTDTPGFYEAEWRVTFADGKIGSFPNDRHLTVAIRPDLG